MFTDSDSTKDLSLLNKISTAKDVETFIGNEKDWILGKQKSGERATTVIQDEELVLSCARPTGFRSLR